MGNPDRTAENAAVIKLAVLWPGVCAIDLGDTLAVLRDVTVIEPVVGVKDAVLDDGVCRTVESVGAVLGGKTFNAGRAAPEFCRRIRVGNLELLQRFDRGRGLIEGRAVLAALDACSIEHNFTAI